MNIEASGLEIVPPPVEDIPLYEWPEEDAAKLLAPRPIRTYRVTYDRVWPSGSMTRSTYELDALHFPSAVTLFKIRVIPPEGVTQTIVTVEIVPET